MAVRWGQVVVGPPGSGKTTYCKGMQQFAVSLDRSPIVVNLDPANDTTPYPCPVDIRDLINVDDVMEAYGLGPNGALVYCMEFLAANFDWLEDRLADFPEHYFLFDCPGQAELYTHHSAVATVLARLQKLRIRLCAVHLVDAHHCSDAGKFIPVALLSLATMMRLELPHVNALTKVDMIKSATVTTALELEAYTGMGDMASILGTLPGRDVWNEDEDVADLGLGALDAGAGAPSVSERQAAAAVASKRRAGRFFARFNKLNEALASVIEDYSLVSFHPVSIEDKASVGALLETIDRAHGFVRSFVKKNSS